MARCPVCNTLSTNQLVTFADKPDFGGYDCPRCGQFYLSGRTVATLPKLISRKAINVSRLSHDLRKAFDEFGSKHFFESADLLPYEEDLAYIPAQRQLDNLIQWIGNSQGPPQEWTEATAASLAARIGAAVSWDNSTEPGLSWIIRAYGDSGLFSFQSSSNGSASQYQLTPEGWRYFGELSRRVVNSRNAFMAMQFGDDQLNLVLKDCFQPASARAGFTLRPLNEKPEAGSIDNQIRAAIRTARFVVADLTHANKGAYFEAGFAEGLGIPVIYACRMDIFKSEDHRIRPHFDTSHMQTIVWDPDKLDLAGKQLAATIRNTLPADAKLED